MQIISKDIAKLSIIWYLGVVAAGIPPFPPEQISTFPIAIETISAIREYIRDFEHA